MKRGASVLVCAAALLCLGAAGLSAQNVVSSKHNLSVSGPGTVKATSEAQVCIFCHAPHNASGDAPLWNRYDSGALYTPYSSSTAFSSPGQPTGASKLCLSCHDGTIALGLVRSPAGGIAFPGDGRLPPGASNLGTDLSNDHPISFSYAAAYSQRGRTLAPPANLTTGPVRLDQSGQLQCTSCHDPHDDQYGKFMVKDNLGAALCTTCHYPLDPDPDLDWWGFAIHRYSNAFWNQVPPNPWPHTFYPSVDTNTCENCHRPHGAASPQRLGIFTPSEQGCLVCHNGNVAAKSIAAELSKPSVHPVTATEVHEPREDLLNPPRHSECVDCHNPHYAGGFSLTPPTPPSALYGVRGQSAAGVPLERIAYEHELCFRCHADSLDLGGLPLVNRQFAQPNTRLEFSSANASYHPVLAVGKNSDVPSLLFPWTVTSTMVCTDCHSNDSGTNVGGTGPRGPHGSIYAPILEKQLIPANGSTESAAIYALCYKCHDRESILGNVAGSNTFSEHEKHVAGLPLASCVACHDPHGVQSVNHLINFNLAYVQRSPTNGLLEFVDGDLPRTGSCSLLCHGMDHVAMTYPRPGP